MIRPKKVMTVARFEFLSTVKRKGFLIAVFGMPLFMVLYFGLISLIGMTAAKKVSEVQLYGVVDLANVLRLEGDSAAKPPELPPEVKKLLEALDRQGQAQKTMAVASGNAVFRPFPDVATARAALDERKIVGFFTLRPDYLKTGAVDSLVRELPGFRDSDAKRRLSSVIKDRLLQWANVPPDVAKLLDKPIQQGEERTITPDGKEQATNVGSEIARKIFPLVFSILFMVSLMTTSGYLLQAVAVEKENRVFEILLASAGPNEILFGKLIGLFGAGMIQILVWFGMAVFGLLASATVFSLAGVTVPWFGIVAGGIYFILGYLVIGSLMIGTSSLGNTAKESQQWGMIWSLMAASPMIMLQILITDPHGVAARILSWFPLATPTTMVFRLSLGDGMVPWWEVAGTMLVLLASIYFSINFGARLFRVGVLLSGARPKLKAVLRQALLSPNR